MPADSLEIHPADAGEQRAAYTNVHEVWGGEQPLEEYLAWRLNSVQHQRACWYVGCLEGRVVTSLGAYPLLFHVGGRQVAGFAIGAVHTVPDCRKRGYAARLMAWVEAHQRQQGAELGLLYSDIDPDYYAAHGYPHDIWTREEAGD